MKSTTDSPSILSSSSVTTEQDINNGDASSTVDPSVNYTDNEPNLINSKVSSA